jgi:phosphoribosyl-ATP pyrophosphohydrolase
MDMQKSQLKVAGFHRKFGFAMGLRLEEMNPANDAELMEWGMSLLQMSRDIKNRAMELQDHGDPRLYRFYHKIEELGELAIGMAKRDEAETADALGDLQYLLLGDCVTFSIPMASVFDEIHRSNMTKTRKSGDNRMKDRSVESGFSPPDLKTAIEKGRAD